jgi:hypothetical protein
MRSHEAHAIVAHAADEVANLTAQVMVDLLVAELGDGTDGLHGQGIDRLWGGRLARLPSRPRALASGLCGHGL